MLSLLRAGIIANIFSAAIASNTTVSLYIPYVVSQDLVGSIAGSNAQATTYVVQCATPPSASDLAIISANNADSDPSTTEMVTEVAATPTFTGLLDSSLGAGRLMARQAASITPAPSVLNPASDNSEDGHPFCNIVTPVTVVQGPSTVSAVQMLQGASYQVMCALSRAATPSTSITEAVCTGIIHPASLPPGQMPLSTTASGGIPVPGKSPLTTTVTLKGNDLPTLLPVTITGSGVGSVGGSSPSSSATGGKASTGGAVRLHGLVHEMAWIGIVAALAIGIGALAL